jgi:hypothetical protein
MYVRKMVTMTKRDIPTAGYNALSASFGVGTNV